MANLASIAMLAEQDGLLLVDKPVQIASHDVLKAVKTRFNLVKIGHGGTLEPNATGLLVLLVGDATRVSGDVMDGDREYSATIRLGRVTDTADREGRTLSESPFDGVTREALDAALPEFRGDIFQTPPAFSVMKRPDTPSYGIVPTDPADAKARLVHVFRLAVTEFAPPLVSFDILCTKGVCVRALAHDLGAQLGCGASLETLRRTRCGRFSVDEALGFMDVMKLDPVAFKDRLVPMARAFA
ncbi:MAG: tRNA pseudouridine(55) synthase TruB [Kiritimatiellae bacterium]|jgi:tRNA pseudouridine55 synthase|nr:tRNA pseudouridine(55) synthase TruB [Kiritimatiellia bacterium]